MYLRGYIFVFFCSFSLSFQPFCLPRYALSYGGSLMSANQKVSSLATTGVFFSLLLAQVIPSVQAAEPSVQEPVRKNWSFKEAGMIPLQSSGRIKPLDTYARENILLITGSRSFESWDPVDLLFSWIMEPSSWEQKKFVRVSRKDVRRQLGLDEERSLFSPQELFQKSYLSQYAEGLSGQPSQVQDPKGQMKGQKETPQDEEMKRILDRLMAFRNIVSGRGWLIIPGADPQAAWSSVLKEKPETRDQALIREQFRELLSTYQMADSGAFDRSAVLIRTSIAGSVPGWKDSQERKLWGEYLYNHLRLFYWAWILYLVAALIAWVPGWLPQKLGQWSMTSAFVAHASGIALRCLIAGRPPVSNMYESIIWVSIGVVVFAAIIYGFQRQKIILPVACVLATLGLIAADAAPAMMDPGLHPLVPVLRSNYWLTIHVLTITLGYAAFALSLGIANVVLFQYLRRQGSGMAARITSLNQLAYRAIQFGVVLLAAGTILGGVWADYSWGRFWGWDPKETWALIALLGYVAMLHARYIGWVGQFGFAAWTVLSFSLVVMAWYGVNFVLGAGLHSYGFSSGGQIWVFSGVALQALYVGLVALMRRKPTHNQTISV